MTSAIGCQYRVATSDQHRWRCTCASLLIPRGIVIDADCQVCPVANGLVPGVSSFPLSSVTSGFDPSMDVSPALIVGDRPPPPHVPPPAPGSSPIRTGNGEQQLQPITTVPLEVVVDWPRNLVYHLYPVRGSVWRDNVHEIRRRISLMTGRRIVSVALDESTESRDVVFAELADLHADVRCFRNNRQLGEAVSLLPILHEVSALPGITFYAHSKGVTHRDTSVVFQAWARRMYALLDRFSEVSERLTQRGFCGLVRTTGQPIAEGPHQWHYPGSFYWFRNDVVAARGLPLNRQSRFLSEQLPSHIVRFIESAALHSEMLSGNPYDLETWHNLDVVSQPPNITHQFPVRSRSMDQMDPFHVDQNVHSITPRNKGQLTAPPREEFSSGIQVRPSPSDPPIPTPARFTREPTRHLIYHIWPHNRSNNWRWNIHQLLRRIDLFDGVRAIGVVTGPDTATLDEVRAEFGAARIDHWFETPNSPLNGEPGHVLSDDGASALLGEGLSFLPLLQTLPRGPDDVTFYGHAKGSRYGDGHPTLRWAAMMYRVNLDHWSVVLKELGSFPMCGAFKRYGDFAKPRNWRWHYSGTFFWFRNGDVFEKSDWARLHPAFYGQVEAWPANLFRAAEVACAFGDDARELYKISEIEHWEHELESWPQDTIRHAGVISDRQYYDVEEPLRTEKWPHLLGVHQIGVKVLHELGCATALDVGSGLGAFLVAAKNSGMDARGFDVSRFQRDFAISKGVDATRYQLSSVADFRIAAPVDAIYCVEVFEHCTDLELDPLAAQFAANCRWLYFTSTPGFSEGDQANGHINVKSREGWIEFFQRHNLEFVRDERSIVPWGMLFQPATLAANGITDQSFFNQEVERGYTTVLWPTMLTIHRTAASEIQKLGCRSVFEIGSGLGAFLLGAQDVGLDCYGMDRNPFERDFAVSQGVAPERYLLGNLMTFQIPRPVDCINCVEVFEHCTDAELHPICRQLAANCRWFYFTSTPYPDERDAEWGHVNLKSREQWIEFFSRYGLEFVRDDQALVSWGLIFKGAITPRATAPSD